MIWRGSCFAKPWNTLAHPIDSIGMYWVHWVLDSAGQRSQPLRALRQNLWLLTLQHFWQSRRRSWLWIIDRVRLHSNYWKDLHVFVFDLIGPISLSLDTDAIIRWVKPYFDRLVFVSEHPSWTSNLIQYNMLYHIIDRIYVLERERGWSSWLKCTRPFFQGLASRTCPPPGKAKRSGCLVLGFKL